MAGDNLNYHMDKFTTSLCLANRGMAMGGGECERLKVLGEKHPTKTPSLSSTARTSILQITDCILQKVCFLKP